MDIAVRHPGIGETVGDYKVVAQLGAGGLGVVYKVERGGRFFALKLLLGSMDGRTKREIRILVHMENPGVVRYVGSDFWPNPARGHPYIVMEYVPRDTLEAFALKHNPSSRQCVRILLDVARTLEEVHEAGVFHPLGFSRVDASEVCHRHCRQQRHPSRGISWMHYLVHQGFVALPACTLVQPCLND